MGSLVLLSLLFLLNHHLQISDTFVNAASKVHIVYLGEKQHDDPVVVTNSHHDMLATLLGSKEAAKDSILYSYKHGFSGFAAKLTKSQADLISEFHGVVRVIPNRIHKLHTTRSWDFLGLDPSSGNIFSDSNMGDGAIIGVIDSGIWPECESFSDKNMGPIPSRWKGICQQGERFNSTNCNRKLIGARWFLKALNAENGENTTFAEYDEFASPRDAHGHGTHTASTAAGSLVENASFRGLGKGIAKGGAPRSRLAIYKACWAPGPGCADADLLKAFDEAIHDGVDVLSVSVGGSVPFKSYVDEEHDGIFIGSFHAVAKGITVVCSAGNDGPFAQTVDNRAPWIISVAATTIDRAFPTAITLGNNQTLLGQSMAVRKLEKRFRGLVHSQDIGVTADSESCKPGTLNATLAAGKVVLCFSVTDLHGLQIAGLSVHAVGGVGVIFANHPDNFPTTCTHIPCIQVNYEVGTEILSYIQKARSPVVKLGRPNTVVREWVSPRVAYFSSRGPSSVSPAVLKPDIAAPGVNILAAWPISSTNHGGFAFDSGTSMACPHVAGIAALVKSLRPHWSPAAIKSAFVTTASTMDTIGDPITAEGNPRKQADPFDYGGGQINPNKAADPGLIYDMSIEDYTQFLCSIGYNDSVITRIMTIKPTSCPKIPHSLLNLNLPSISVPNLIKTVTISRTVTNVGPINSQYKALVQSPSGVKIVVKPSLLSFNSTTTKITFRMTISSTKVKGDYSFGSLTWSDGEHLVTSPIAVRAVNFYSKADF